MLDASQSPAGVCVFVIVAPSTIGDISPLVGRAPNTAHTTATAVLQYAVGLNQDWLTNDSFIHSYDISLRQGLFLVPLSVCPADFPPPCSRAVFFG